MSKRLSAMRHNPRGDWKIEDVKALCREFDLLCQPVSGGGSHYKIGHPNIPTKLTVPFKRPTKTCILSQAGRTDRRRKQVKMNANEYAIIVQPLPDEDGGGFIATVPDLPGCMSDGETPQEALANVQDAIRAWIEAANDLGHKIPEPTRRFELTA